MSAERSKFTTIAFIALGVVACYSLVTSIWLKSKLRSSAAAIGWELSIASAFTLFPGHISARHVRAYDRRSGCDVYSESARAQFNLLSLFRDRVVVDRLSLDGVSVECADKPAVARNLADLLPTRTPTRLVLGFIGQALHEDPRVAAATAARQLYLGSIEVGVERVGYGDVVSRGAVRVHAEGLNWAGQVQHIERASVMGKTLLASDENVGTLQISLNWTGHGWADGSHLSAKFPSQTWTVRAQAIQCLAPLRAVVTPTGLATGLDAPFAFDLEVTGDLCAANSAAGDWTPNWALHNFRLHLPHVDGKALATLETLAAGSTLTGSLQSGPREQPEAMTWTGDLMARAQLQFDGHQLSRVELKRSSLSNLRITLGNTEPWVGAVNVFAAGRTASSDPADGSVFDNIEGRVRIQGPDASPLVDWLGIDALPEWLTEKFVGYPFALVSRVRIQDSSWLRLDEIKLTRGEITVEGWLNRAANPELSRGALLFTYGGLSAGIEISRGSGRIQALPSQQWREAHSLAVAPQFAD